MRKKKKKTSYHNYVKWHGFWQDQPLQWLFMQYQLHIPSLVIKIIVISKWQVVNAVSAEKLYLFILTPLYNLDYPLFIVQLENYSCYWFFFFLYF